MQTEYVAGDHHRSPLINGRPMRMEATEWSAVHWLCMQKLADRSRRQDMCACPLPRIYRSHVQEVFILLRVLLRSSLLCPSQNIPIPRQHRLCRFPQARCPPPTCWRSDCTNGEGKTENMRESHAQYTWFTIECRSYVHVQRWPSNVSFNGPRVQNMVLQHTSKLLNYTGLSEKFKDIG